MVIVDFGGINPQGVFQKGIYGGPTINFCFDALTALVNAGWQLDRIELFEQNRCRVKLPIEAFDGASLSEHMGSLQEEWEQILLKAV